MTNVPETLLRNSLFIALLTVFALGAAGCISQQPEMLKVNPVTDYNPLEGFYGKSEGMFTVLKGSIPEVKETLKDIVIKKAPQTTTFSVDDELNFVVFRGVFSSGGYGINIDKVERQENAFTVYAIYIDPGEGILVTGAVTQPVAIIPIGKLAAGDYEARLKVTRVKADADGTKIIRKVIEPEKELSVFNFKVKTPEEGDSSEISSIPDTIIGVDSYNPPAYRGISTLVTLVISGINVAKGDKISLEYKTEILRTDTSLESEPEWMQLIPEKKPLVFQRTVRAGEQPEKLYFNLTVNLDKEATDGEYYVTVSGKDKGLVFGSAVLSFKIGKGGKLPLPKKNVWNIGYRIPSSLSDEERAIGSSSLIVSVDKPPLSEEEKAEAIAIAVNDTSLKGKSYRITGVSLGFYESGNFSGFFPVVTVDIGEPDKPGAIVSYVIDLEEKRVFGSTSIPRRPAPIEAPTGYFSGQAFDEAAGILTKKWDAGNFAGFWRDSETGASTEALIINQSILNNSYRVIEKRNLTYTTKPVPLKYQVYARANKTPPGTEGFYSAIGWLGKKYVLLQGSKLARIIFEQNVADVKTMHQRESWALGDGYKLYANSVDVPLRGEEQAWITFFKDNTLLEDKVLPNNYLYSYPENITSDGAPIFVTYTSNIYRLPQEDVADFKYTWLRSQNITEIKEGDIFGIMEVTSVKNGTIELRNKEPINLAPDAAIHLMGGLSIHIGSSKTSLLFYPAKGWYP